MGARVERERTSFCIFVYKVRYLEQIKKKTHAYCHAQTVPNFWPLLLGLILVLKPPPGRTVGNKRSQVHVV
jgi:hypothetical protein